MQHLGPSSPAPFPYFSNNKLQEESKKCERSQSQRSARLNLVDEEELKAAAEIVKPFTSQQRRGS